ncbi:MAG: serine protease [Patescibacteria group bacterium]
MQIGSKFAVLSLCIIFVSCNLFSSCNSKSDVSKQKEGCRHGSFVQDFKTDVAWIVNEWNCKPGGYGSGFLIDKERGAFYTNKHVANEFNNYGKGSHKIYFNGKFYNAEVVKVPPLRDAAIVRITDAFDPSEFPEPAPFVTEKVKMGDKVFIEGFHPHPYFIIESNKTEGYDEKTVPIWEKYYNLGTRNLDKKQEVVFEKITGKVVKLNAMIAFEDTGDTVDKIKELSNTYIVVKVDRDHKFSFGGLSGTVVRNVEGEVVGIVTLKRANYELDKEETEKSQDGNTYLKQVYNVIGFTPIESVADLRQYLIK